MQVDKILAVLFAIIIGSAIASPILDDADPRIIGGSTAAVGQFPYQVSLRSLNNTHFCGGSIISNQWILTAAHCIFTRLPPYVKVYVNTTTIDGGTPYDLTQFIQHPSFLPFYNLNDIAVLRTSTSISFGTNVSPISLASSVVAPGTSLILAGWGLTSYPIGQSPYYLQYISLTTISVAECQSLLPGYGVSNNNTCTLDRVGQGPCIGDSDGPLVLGTEQQAIVSWATDCATGHPHVHTSVPAYRSWIQSVTGV